VTTFCSFGAKYRQQQNRVFVTAEYDCGTDSVQAVLFLFADTFHSFVRISIKIQRTEIRP